MDLIEVCKQGYEAKEYVIAPFIRMYKLIKRNKRKIEKALVKKLAK